MNLCNCISALIGAKANINEADNKGSTPLINACYNCHFSCVCNCHFSCVCTTLLLKGNTKPRLEGSRLGNGDGWCFLHFVKWSSSLWTSWSWICMCLRFCFVYLLFYDLNAFAELLLLRLIWSVCIFLFYECFCWTFAFQSPVACCCLGVTMLLLLVVVDVIVGCCWSSWCCGCCCCCCWLLCWFCWTIAAIVQSMMIEPSWCWFVWCLFFVVVWCCCVVVVTLLLWLSSGHCCCVWCIWCLGCHIVVVVVVVFVIIFVVLIGVVVVVVIHLCCDC